MVERAGEVVGKEELIARAWPQTFVEESNLKIQVSALRRALGDGHGGRLQFRCANLVCGASASYDTRCRVDLLGPRYESPRRQNKVQSDKAQRFSL
jgi:hypothetical protein